MRVVFWSAAVVVATLFTSASPVIGAAGRRQAAERPTLSVGAETRLLVVAPHPDDEMLGVAGLTQRVRELNGNVHVIYLTDGDGYPEGVQVQDHIETPSSSDYRGYGRRRRSEARAALRAIGIPDEAHTFLSFPDGGLWFLNGFVRANEVFSRPGPPHVVLPARRNLCCDQ